MHRFPSSLGELNQIASNAFSWLETSVGFISKYQVHHGGCVFISKAYKVLWSVFKFMVFGFYMVSVEFGILFSSTLRLMLVKEIRHIFTS